MLRHEAGRQLASKYQAPLGRTPHLAIPLVLASVPATAPVYVPANPQPQRRCSIHSLGPHSQGLERARQPLAWAAAARPLAPRRRAARPLATRRRPGPHQARTRRHRTAAARVAASSMGTCRRPTCIMPAATSSSSIQQPWRQHSNAARLPPTHSGTFGAPHPPLPRPACPPLCMPSARVPALQDCCRSPLTVSPCLAPCRPQGGRFVRRAAAGSDAIV